MGNIHFAVLAPPDKHRDIVREVNKWKYDVEGSKFKGKVSPYISELRFYEIRTLDELEPKVIRDLQLTDMLDVHGGDTRNWKYDLLNRIAKLLRMTTPYKPLPKRADGPPQYQLPPWYYAISIGKLARKKVKTQIGTEREVL